MKTRQKEKEKEKRSEEKKVLLRIKLGTFVRHAGPHRYNWATWNSEKNLRKYIIETVFPSTSACATVYTVDRALLNMNSKVFFRRMTAVCTVKTQRKRISSHLKNGSPTKPIRYKLVCEQNVFCYRDVRSYLAESIVSLSCGQLLRHGWEYPENTRELESITQIYNIDI